MWYYYSPITMAQIRWLITPVVDKNVEKLELPYIVGRNLDGKITLQSDLVVSQEVKPIAAMWSTHYIPRYLLLREQHKSVFLKFNMNAHSSLMYNSHQLEKKLMSSEKGPKNHVLLYSYNGILPSNKGVNY